MLIHKTDDDKDHPFIISCDMSELEEIYDLIKYHLEPGPTHEPIRKDTLVHWKYKLEQVTGKRPPV